MKVKAAAVSPPIKGDRLQVMKRCIEEKTLDLAVFPEEYFGYDWYRSQYTYITKEEVVNGVSDIAEQNNLHIVAGFLESTGTSPRKFWNKALLFSPSGLVGEYIKTTLGEWDISHGQLPGNKIEVFDTEIGKIAMLICWEVWFPELARIAALKGAEIICFPTGYDIGIEDKAWQTLWWARAIENNAYVIECVNAKGSVISSIYSPEKILARSREEGVITADLDIEHLRKLREGNIETEIEPALIRRRSTLLKEVGCKMMNASK